MWADWKAGAIKATQGHRSWPVLGCSRNLGSQDPAGSHLGPWELVWYWGRQALRSVVKLALTSPSLSYRENVSLLWVAHAWGKVDKDSVNLSFLFSSMCLHLFLCFT